MVTVVVAATGAVGFLHRGRHVAAQDAEDQGSDAVGQYKGGRAGGEGRGGEA